MIDNPAVCSTLLEKEAHVGDTDIVIVESAAVEVNDQVIIAAGTNTQEVNSVVGFGTPCEGGDGPHDCVIHLGAPLKFDHPLPTTVSALNRRYYGVWSGTNPPDKVPSLPPKPNLPGPPPQIVNPVGHCKAKYPEGILGSKATDCDAAVLGGVATCLALRTGDAKYDCSGCGLCPAEDVYIYDTNVSALARMGGFGGKYKCPGGAVYNVGASVLDLNACGEPQDDCRAMAGVGGQEVSECFSGSPGDYRMFKVICGAAQHLPKGCVSNPTWYNGGVPSQNCKWTGNRYPLSPPGLPSGGDCRCSGDFCPDPKGNNTANVNCCECGGGTYPNRSDVAA